MPTDLIIGEIQSFRLSEARKGAANVGFDSWALVLHLEASKLKALATALMLEFAGFEVKLLRSVEKRSEPR